MQILCACVSCTSCRDTQRCIFCTVYSLFVFVSNIIGVIVSNIIVIPYSSVVLVVAVYVHSNVYFDFLQCVVGRAFSILGGDLCFV